MPRIPALLVSLAVLCLQQLILPANDKRPKVHLSFHLAETTWRVGVKDEGSIVEFESKTAGDLAKELQAHFSFLRFVTHDPALPHLKVSITSDKPGGSEQMVTSYFDIELSNLPEEADKKLRVPFRPAEDYGDSVSYNSFRNEMSVRLRYRLNRGFADKFVSDLLAYISLADKIHLVDAEGDKLCVLPLTCQDIHAGPASHFTIKTSKLGILRNHYTLVIPVGGEFWDLASDEFKDHLVVDDRAGVSSIERPHIPLENLKLPVGKPVIKIKGLYLTRFTPACPEAEPSGSPTGFEN